LLKNILLVFLVSLMFLVSLKIVVVVGEGRRHVGVDANARVQKDILLKKKRRRKWKLLVFYI
jgi:hypothetical protein